MHKTLVVEYHIFRLSAGRLYSRTSCTDLVYQCYPFCNYARMLLRTIGVSWISD